MSRRTGVVTAATVTIAWVLASPSGAPMAADTPRFGAPRGPRLDSPGVSADRRGTADSGLNGIPCRSLFGSA
jgi:hypothetical protein